MGEAVPYLTEKQRDVFGFISRHIDNRGVAPTLQEIADRFGFSSTASAQKHVALLEKKGFVRRVTHHKRGLEVVGDAAAADSSITHLPLLGTVAAGSPLEVFPDHETVGVPSDLLTTGDHFVLRVRGDSMIEDGIHDGDHVIVRRTANASRGDMVVALVAGEVTLKRFHPAGATVRLQPANRSMPPLLVPAQDVSLQGVVVGLIRRY